MKRSLVIIAMLVSFASGYSQINISLSNPGMLPVLQGNYDPGAFTPPVIINHPDSILHGIITRISRDTLIHYLGILDGLHNRNSGSDTLAANSGIGAARRWICSKFDEYRQNSGNRLMVSYLDFNAAICGRSHHRDVLAVLPGLDTTDKEIVVVEGHYDTRCEGVCDTSCYSPGMDDNGSGTVLVMELARIMSRYAFDHTIVFACVTGEDQGLFGAKALANFLKNNGVKIRCVLNNDVIGGVVCGQTASPPGCPGLNSIDSTHVRIFSYSPSNDSSAASAHKQLARYIRLHQEERINPLLATPMTVDLMIAEDRTGRSGDHIPFRQKGYTAIRFTSRNEHGNGSGTPPDRQHSVRDILGVDTTVPPDGVIDSFYVDPGYLRRNIIMNGVNLGWLAIAPPIPVPEYLPSGSGLTIRLHGADTVYKHYRVTMRTKGSGSIYFDTVFTFFSDSIHLEGISPQTSSFFSVANVRNGVESLFSQEYCMAAVDRSERLAKDWGVRMVRNHPNPFQGCTMLCVETTETFDIREGAIEIRDVAGRLLESLPIRIGPGENRYPFCLPYSARGIFTYSLVLSGAVVFTGKMVSY